MKEPSQWLRANNHACLFKPTLHLTLLFADYNAQIGDTLYVISNVTYYLELCNAITVYCTSNVLPTKVDLVVWTL